MPERHNGTTTVNGEPVEPPAKQPERNTMPRNATLPEDLSFGAQPNATPSDGPNASEHPLPIAGEPDRGPTGTAECNTPSTLAGPSPSRANGPSGQDVGYPPGLPNVALFDGVAGAQGWLDLQQGVSRRNRRSCNPTAVSIECAHPFRTSGR